MSAIIGNLPHFEIGNDWSVFKERLQLWFSANLISTKSEGDKGTQKDDRRRAVLLSALSETAYKLVRELVAPKKVEELSYEQILSETDKHLLPKKSLFAERHYFHSATQMVGEGFTQWAARVRHLSTDCGFGSSVEDMLRDRFILGMQAGPERDKLFMEDPENLSLSKALDIAESVSSARKAARESATAVAQARAALTPAAEVYRVASAASSASSNPRCEVCGYNNHSVEKCKFKGYKCKKCGVKGHLKRMCTKDKSQINMLQAADESHGDDGERFSIYNIRSYSGEAMKLSVEVCGELIDFEVDSGSCATTIPIDVYKQKFSHMPLSYPRTILKSYSGQVVNVTGILRAQIKYEAECKYVDIYIVNGQGPALLGRDFLSLFNLQLSKVNHCSEKSEVEFYMTKFPKLFSNRLGCLNKFKVKLTLKPDSHPIFFRPRPVPFALKAKIEQEIGRLVKEGVLQPIDKSDFASPTVPVLKHNGDIRLCADFSVTLNKLLQIEKYPLPRTEELFAKLHGGQQFSQLDLSNAYLQLCLDEDSQILTTINTHKGLFKFTRLVFGLANAPAIFQKTMETLLQGIDGVLCLLDDVLVTGKTKQEHSDRLEQVFRRFEEAGLVLNKDKCHLFQDTVTYLGFKIDKFGIHKCPEKVKAMLGAKPPSNIHELKSFLGLVNYYRVFVPQASSILCPLNNLLQKEAKWEWTQVHDEAFNKIKRELASDIFLAHYNPQCKLVLTVDASPWGLGAVLAQLEGDCERPIAYASRSLNSAEKQYSQIQKEATAIVFGIKRFHQYLYGLDTPFILRTDHKPLIYIFHPQKGIPEVSANRLQRYALFLNSYNYEIQYVNTTQNCADFLSRSAADSDNKPVPTTSSHSDAAHCSLSPIQPQPPPCVTGPFIDRATYINFVTEGDLPITLEELRNETQVDPLLSLISQYVMKGWPVKNKRIELQTFFSCSRELSWEQGCLMRGHKIVVPNNLQPKILRELHRTHFGVNKTKADARALFWWPNIDRDIENMVAGCPICMQFKPTPPRAPLTPWPFPPVPWSRVHMDFFGPLHGKMFLVFVDAYTKWIECFPLSGSYSSVVVIEKLQEVMSRFGNIQVLVSDNGSSFTSQEFRDYCTLNGITHLTSPTYSPSSNGQAEICVKILKKHIKALFMEGKSWPQVNARILEFLFRYRNSKHTTTDKSPAELMFGRPLRTRFDLLKSHTEVPSSLSPSSREVTNHVNDKQCSQIKYYNGKRNIQVNINDAVLIKMHNNNKWIKGFVIKKIGKSLYNIFVPELNQTLKKHVNQLYKLKTTQVGRANDMLSSETPHPGTEETQWAFTDTSGPGNNIADECSGQPMQQSVIGQPQPASSSPGGGTELDKEEEWLDADPALETELPRVTTSETVQSESPGPSPRNRSPLAVNTPITVTNRVLRTLPKVDYKKYF